MKCEFHLFAIEHTLLNGNSEMERFQRSLHSRVKSIFFSMLTAK